MFVRILGGLVLLAALLWVVMYVSAGAAMREARRAPWPYGIGTIDDVDADLGSGQQRSSEAKEVERLLGHADLGGDGLGDYVDAQTAKKDDAIDAPPTSYDLVRHQALIAEMARTINAAGDRIVWGAEGPDWSTDDAGTLLAAAALDRARNGDGAAAWDDLHAAWLLACSLRGRIGAPMAMTVRRTTNAVARKLPAPAPAWTAQLAAMEPRRDAAAVIQQETATRLRGSRLPGPLIVFRPISDWIEASNARRARAAAESMAKSPQCRIDTNADSSHSDEVYRAARVEAEVEATAKVLALKNERARLGRWPASLPGIEASRCGESRWIYQTSPDGRTMKLHMSWEVAAEPGQSKSSPALQFAY